MLRGSITMTSVTQKIHFCCRLFIQSSKSRQQSRYAPSQWETSSHCNNFPHSRVTLYTAGHLHTAVPHCWHSRAPIVHTAVPRENNEHGCVYLRCRAVCKLPGCVEGHPWLAERVPRLILEISYLYTTALTSISYVLDPQSKLKTTYFQMISF